MQKKFFFILAIVTLIALQTNTAKIKAVRFKEEKKDRQIAVAYILVALSKEQPTSTQTLPTKAAPR